MINDLIELHARLDVQTKKTRNKSAGCFVIKVKPNLRNYLNFQEKIGFEYGVITKGHNLGRLKKEVLRETINKKINKHNRAIN